MLKQAVVFGFGRFFFENESCIRSKYEIVGIVDNDAQKEGWSYKGITISRPGRIAEISYDIVLVVTRIGKSNILRQLINELNISSDKIVLWFEEGGLDPKQYKTTIITETPLHPEILFEVNVEGRDPVRFVLEESGEYMCFDEWFCMDQYRIDVKGDFGVIDIGMNVGMATLYYASFKGCKAVYSFEPFEQTYRKAVRNIQMNENLKDKIKSYNYAISDHEAQESYDYNVEYPGGMSILGPQSTGDCVGSSIINVHPASKVLGPIMDEIETAERDILMKVDCEGSEYAILSDLKKSNLIRKPKYYVMETHCNRHEEAVSLLKECDYVVFSYRIDRELGVIYAVRNGD